MLDGRLAAVGRRAGGEVLAMTASTPGLVGASVRRQEDVRLLTGRGRYVDDLQLPGMLHVAFVRSPHAHARVHAVDAEGARRAPGLVDVVTGAEARERLGPLPGFAWRIPGPVISTVV